MNTAPEDISPVSSVPEAADKKGNQQVPSCPPGSSPVAAQRNVYIISEPGGQGYVPAAPEFTDGSGKVRTFEVDHEVDIQKTGGSYCDVGVA